MPLYRIQDLKEVLLERGLAPRKSMGQNFLINRHIIEKIVDLASIQEGDLALEIGPGVGAISEEILLRGAHLTAIEIDRGLCAHLRSYFEGKPLHLVEDSCLNISLSDLFLDHNKQSVKFIANLPYNITSPILDMLLSSSVKFASYTFIVQKEVAQRICAKNNSKELGLLSLFIQLHLDIFLAFDVKPNSFLPPPKVTSAVVHGIPHYKYSKDIIDQTMPIAKKAFGQRRKMLRSSLKELISTSDLESFLEDRGLRLDVRPENLSLEDFIELGNLIGSLT